MKVVTGAGASRFLHANDVILSFDRKEINNILNLLDTRMSGIGTNTEIVIFRNLKETKGFIKQR